MMKREDCLVEIHTEELPPKALLKLAEAFCSQVKERLQKAEFVYDDVLSFATPRRLALLIKNLASATPEQVVERKGPALSAAFDAEGKPTPACIGFARSCGVAANDLYTIKSPQGEWVGYQQKMPGKSIMEALPPIVEQAALALPIPKRMRWGASDVQFVRPVHSVIMLYGDQVIPATLFGHQAGRVTRGHRFMAPAWMSIPHASAYASLLETEGFVIADFAKRRDIIREQSLACVQQKLLGKGRVFISSEALLDEVTGLVEWPVALCGEFDADFLALPEEVLISSMQDHQRYFPVVDAHDALLPYFVTISNIKTHEPERIVHGNERVLRARLSDAAFFCATDKKEKLEARVERLKGIVFQAKLGTLYDKAERLSRLAGFIATKVGMHPELVLLSGVAGVLAKTDLTTNMVGEFPELQGVMGYYYALHDGEREEIAIAMKEQYMPRFAGDFLPSHPVGQVLAMTDRLDTLVGAFGINQIPTGDKDPYGLRRAALGVLRILIENKVSLDLKAALDFALSCYGERIENAETVKQVLGFFQERLRAWYQEQGVPADVFASVAALGITIPLDIHERIKAVQAFKKLSEAETLSVANKRVSNILAKYVDAIDAKTINPTFFEGAVEQELARQLQLKSETVARLYEMRKYDQVLLQLADLHKPIDDFFEQVMVMTEDKEKRENRLLLLMKLRALFLQVADIALLQ
jgi:glycyl-tRNA synthetase beta chain